MKGALLALILLSAPSYAGFGGSRSSYGGGYSRSYSSSSSFGGYRASPSASSFGGYRATSSGSSWFRSAPAATITRPTASPSYGGHTTVNNYGSYGGGNSFLTNMLMYQMLFGYQNQVIVTGQPGVAVVSPSWTAGDTLAVFLAVLLVVCVVAFMSGAI